MLILFGIGKLIGGIPISYPIRMHVSRVVRYRQEIGIVALNKLFIDLREYPGEISVIWLELCHLQAMFNACEIIFFISESGG
jgi:hypothetical protein